MQLNPDYILLFSSWCLNLDRHCKLLMRSKREFQHKNIIYRKLKAFINLCASGQTGSRRQQWHMHLWHILKWTFLQMLATSSERYYSLITWPLPISPQSSLNKSMRLPIFINLSPIFIAQFCFFVLFLLYHFSCKLKIRNRIVKDPDEVAEDCMTL